MVTHADVVAARERIRDQIVQTPCTRSLCFGDVTPARLHIKYENLQRTGSFKDRGSLNRLLQLTSDERRAGVVTASAGNHAQAVAYHSARLGIPATVVMPETTPLIKVSNTRRYGARVVLHGTRFSQAIEESRRLQADEGLTMVHAYDDDQVIAGQGTLGLELLEQVPDLTTVIVPIGGGGVISGTAVAVKAARPSARIIGVEVEAAPSAWMSRQTGSIAEIETEETLADGIAVKRVGDRTFPIIEELVERIVVVDEEEIATAIQLLLERQKTVAEGAGAAPLAALLERVRLSEDEVAVLVLCGGNIDINIISRIIDRGMVRDGRKARLVVKVRDRPGALARLTALVARHGANVLEVAHHRAYGDISVGEVEIVVHLETRGRDHVAEVLGAIRDEGVEVEEVV